MKERVILLAATLIAAMLAIISVSYSSGKGQSGVTSGKTAPETTTQQSEPKPTGTMSDLSVDKVWLDDQCRINIKLKNAGTYIMSDKEHSQGMVRVYFGKTHEDFYFKKISAQKKSSVDQNGALKKPGSTLSYNTKIELKETLRVSAYVGVMNSLAKADKQKGKSLTLTPQPSSVAQKLEQKDAKEETIKSEQTIVAEKKSLSKSQSRVRKGMTTNIFLEKVASKKTKLEIKHQGKVVGVDYVNAGERVGIVTIPSSKKIDTRATVLDIFADGKKIGVIDMAQEPFGETWGKLDGSKTVPRVNVRHLADTFGNEAGPGAIGRGYRLDCLRVNGSNRNQSVDDEIELSTDFSNLSPGIEVSEHRVYIQIVDNSGGTIHSEYWDLTTNPRLSLNLSLLGVTPGEYEVCGSAYIHYIGQSTCGHSEPESFWGWWPTNNMKVYYRVEPPIIMGLPAHVEPFVPPEDLTLGAFHATVSNNRVSPDQLFAIYWDEFEGAEYYRVRFNTGPPHSPFPGVCLYMEECSAEGPFHVNSMINFMRDEFRRTHPDHFRGGDEVDDVLATTPIYAQVTARVRNGGGYTNYGSSVLVIHVSSRGSHQPAAPSLGERRRDDGVFLFWSHVPSGEGTFTIERAYVWEDRVDRWETYRHGIPQDQNTLFIPAEDLSRGDFDIRHFAFRMHFLRSGPITPDSVSPHSNVVTVNPIPFPPILWRVITYPSNPSWSSCWAWDILWNPNDSDADIDYEDQVSTNPSFSEPLCTGGSSVGVDRDGSRHTDYYFPSAECWESLEGSPRLYLRRRTHRLGSSGSESPWSNVLMIEFVD